tara:strand:- start:334 stop:501 length:168 start_codon:yes stop_codon:yes gene_type:complete
LSLLEWLDYLGKPGRVNVVNRVIFALSLFDTPPEKPVDAPVSDVYRCGLIALLVE